MAKKNHGLKMKTSKKIFTKNAVKTKTINNTPPICRGGIRL